MKIVMSVEYCGSGFHGWQRQRQVPTLQGCIEQALSSVAAHPVEVHCAGRTDAGVHALHQVIHFETTARRALHSWVLGGNAALPHSISLLWAREMADDFHARFAATGRTYRYVILNRRIRPGLKHGQVAWEAKHLDLERMYASSRCFLGEHDFSSYRAAACQAKSPVREIRRFDIRREGALIVLEIEANAFLYHMVRNMAGVLMAIGRGSEDIEWAEQVLDARDRTAGGVTAPAAGLYLVDVEYPEHFQLPKAAGASALFSL